MVTGYIATDWVSIFWHWQTYALAVTGLLAVFLTQNAYHAGPIAASQSTLVLIDPLASILIGIGLFGDDLRTAGAWGPLEALQPARPLRRGRDPVPLTLVSGVKGEGELGGRTAARGGAAPGAWLRRSPSPPQP